MRVITGTILARASRAKRDSDGTVAAVLPKKGTNKESLGSKFMSGSRYKGSPAFSRAITGRAPSSWATRWQGPKRWRPWRIQASDTGLAWRV